MDFYFVGYFLIFVCSVGALFLLGLYWFLRIRNRKPLCKAGLHKDSPQLCVALLESDPSPSRCFCSHIPTKPNTTFGYLPAFPSHGHDYGYLPNSSGRTDTPPVSLVWASCGAPPHVPCAPPPSRSCSSEHDSGSLFNSVACDPAAEHLSETLKTMDPLPFQPPFSDRSIPDATDFPHGKADTRSQLIDDSLSQLIHGKADTKNKSHGIGGAATSMTGYDLSHIFGMDKSTDMFTAIQNLLAPYFLEENRRGMDKQTNPYNLMDPSMLTAIQSLLLPYFLEENRRRGSEFQPPFSDRSIPDATDFPHGKADTRSQLIDDSLSQLIHGKADTKNKSHGIGGAATSMTGYDLSHIFGMDKSTDMFTAIQNLLAPYFLEENRRGMDKQTNPYNLMDPSMLTAIQSLLLPYFLEENRRRGSEEKP